MSVWTVLAIFGVIGGVIGIALASSSTPKQKHEH